jgi:hypothetical protein
VNREPGTGDDRPQATPAPSFHRLGSTARGKTGEGAGELRLTAIHGAGRFDTEWLSGQDPIWASKPK